MPAAVAVLVTGFLLYILINALAPACLRFLLALRIVVPPFVIAIALALLIDPLVTALESRGIPRIGAVLIIFIAVTLLLAASAAYVAPKAVVQVNQLVSDAPGYYERISEFVAGLMDRARPLLDRIDLPTTASEVADRFSAQIGTGAGAVGTFIWSGLGQIVSRSLWLVLIILLTFMLLADLNGIRARAILLIPEAHRDRVANTGRDVGNLFVRYLRGLIVVCVVYGAVSAVLFSILGIRYSLLIGLTAGALYAIPYLGAFLTTLIVLTVAALQHPDAVYLAFVFAGISVGLNQAFDMVITPRIVGGAVGLHPVVSIFALMLGGAAFGIIGMLLAVPVAGSLQLMLRDIFPQLAQPAVKPPVGQQPAPDEEARVQQSPDDDLIRQED